MFRGTVRRLAQKVLSLAKKYQENLLGEMGIMFRGLFSKVLGLGSLFSPYKLKAKYAIKVGFSKVL